MLGSRESSYAVIIPVSIKDDTAAGARKVLTSVERLAQQVSGNLGKQGQPSQSAQARLIQQHEKHLQQLERDRARFAAQEQRDNQRHAQQLARDRERYGTQAANAQGRAAERAAQAQQRAETQAAREVQRIHAQTRRQAEQQDNLRARAVQQLARQEADTRIREARRAGNEVIRLIGETTRAERAAARERERAASTGGFFKSSSPFAGIVGGIGVAAITAELSQGGRAWLDYSSKLETTRIAFSTMLGSAQAASDHLKDLQQFAIKTPFEFSELLDASARMRALGFATEEVIPLLRDVGNVTAASGEIGGDRLQRIIKALADVRSRGALYSAEIRQFAEAAIPVYDILEKELGKSRAELVKMVEAGEISSEIFLQAFQKFSRQNFGDLMEKQSRTFTGAMSNIKDILLQTSATAFEPFYHEISQLTVRTAREIEGQDFEGAIQTIFENAFRGAGKAAAEAGVDIINELFDSAEKQADKRRRSFNPVMFGAAAADSFIEQFKREIQGIREGQMSMAELEREANAILKERAERARADAEREARRGASTSRAVVDPAATKAMEKAAAIVKDLNTEIRFFGDNSAVAATKQKLLAAGVTDLNSGLAAQAIQLASVLDKMKQMADIAEAERRRQFESEQSLIRELEAVGSSASERAVAIADEMAGGISELKKFDLSMLAARAKAAGADFAGVLEITRKQLANLDETAANKKAFDERKQIFESATAAAKALRDSLLDALNPPKTKFDELLRDIQKIEKLPSIIASMARDQRELFETFPEGEQRAASFTAIFQKLIATSSAAQGVSALTADEIARLAGQFGVAADAALRLDKNMREAAALEAYKSTLESLNEVINADVKVTHSQRTEKLLLTDAYKNLTDAQRQSLLAHAAEADRMEVLREAQAKWKTQVEDLRNTTQNFFEGAINASIEGRWRGLMNFLVNEFKRALARMLAAWLTSSVLRSITGATVGGQQGGQGGGIFQNLFGGLFGGGGARGAVTPPFAGGSIPGLSFGAGGVNFNGGTLTGRGLDALISGRAADFFGGLATPPSLSQQATQTAAARAIEQAAQGGTATITGALSGGSAAARLSLGGIGSALAPVLPFLGLSLGASLGGPSRAGSLLGGAGGLLLGGAGLAALAPGLLAGLFGGASAGGIGAAAAGALGGSAAGGAGGLGAIAGLFSNPVTAIVGGALLVGAVLLRRNARERRDERIRDQVSNDTGTAIWALIDRARLGSLTVAEAQQEFSNIRSRYFQGIQNLQGRARRHAELQWNDFQALWPILEQNARESELRQNERARMSPVFAGGGYNKTDQLVRVRPGEGILAPGAQHIARVPGRDLGYDSVHMWLPRGARVIPVADMRHAAPMANGGVVGGPTGVAAQGGRGGLRPDVNVSVDIDADMIATVVIDSPLFAEAVVKKTRVARRKKQLP